MKAYLLPVAMASILAACAGPTTPRVASSGANNVAPTSFSWAPVSGKEGSDLAQAKKLLGEALAGRGYQTADNAGTQLEVTLSSLPAELAVIAGKSETLSKHKKRRLFQKCDDQEYRLGVALTRISDGAALYRGTAAAYHCKQSISQALPSLVSAVVANMGGSGS